MPLFLSSFIFEKKEYDDEFYALDREIEAYSSTIPGNDSNLLIVFYVQIMPDDLVMQLHRF